MALLTRDALIQAITRLGEIAASEGSASELLIVGGGVMVLVQPHLQRGRELTARYAFEDLWELKP